MSDIQRAAWLVIQEGEGESFTTRQTGGVEYWTNNGFRVAPVVEVQPVLEALKDASSSPYTFKKLAEIIDQLEKAAQP